MEAFNDEMALEEYYKWAEGRPERACHFDVWVASWRTLRDLFATKTFVPREPVVVHGPMPDKLPQFEGINYPIGGKPVQDKETK